MKAHLPFLAIACAIAAWGCGSGGSSEAALDEGTAQATDAGGIPIVVPETDDASQSPDKTGDEGLPPIKTGDEGLPPIAEAPTNPLLTRTARVLCIGDSMTAGKGSDPTAYRSYRGQLFNKLATAGYSVDFVGTQYMHPAVGGDPDHDGYGGAYIGPGGSANNLTDRLPGILANADPDIIILALGWNSVYNEPSVAGEKYRTFVNSVASAKPKAHIVLATLSPQRGQSESQSATSLPGYRDVNSVARSLAGASTTDRYYLADFAAGGFQESEYWDVIHWLQPGADRAAQIIYDTLINGPLKR